MSGYALDLVTAATGYPVTLQDAKRSLRAEHIGQEDRTLESDLIPTATEHLENETRRQYMLATYEMKLDGWWGSGVLSIPRPPLLSITSITYYDTDNAAQTLSATVYGVLAKGADTPFGGIYRKSGQSWPSLYGQDHAFEVVVRFTCGYSSSAVLETQRAAVPAAARRAILMMVEDADGDRGIGGTGTIRTPDNPRFHSYVSQLAVPVLWHATTEAA